MRWFNKLSLQTKLFASFALVIVLTTVLGYILINVFVDRAFADFTLRNIEVQDRVILQVIANYYERWGSLEGVEEILERSERPIPIVLVDPQGKVVFAEDERLEGRVFSPEQLEGGIGVRVSGGLTWTILPVTLTPWRNPLEERFGRSVNSALWIAGLVVGAIGILLAVGLLRQIMGPLRRLDAATRRIAQGEFSERIMVPSNDELGHLAQSFNTMATSLEEAERTKRQLIADVSHELRTPITILRTALEGLRDGVVEPTPQNFAALQNKVLLTGRLVEDLQQLALADAGRLSIRQEPCHLQDLFDEIRATIGVQLEDSDIDLQLDLQADLPVVKIDRQRIEQVILNLLSNAMRYTPEGGVIRIAARVENGMVETSVCDNGPGLTEDEARHVFDRFYRADRAREREGGGAGLGLAIAKALVEAHGGGIWAESGPEGGACFRFALPVKPQEDSKQ
jgi:two-component system sensor histidine kinase BaeS